jgi:hypothetical protein
MWEVIPVAIIGALVPLIVKGGIKLYKNKKTVLS